MASTGKRSFEAAVLGGWSEFDLTWERHQESAAEHAPPNNYGHSLPVPTLSIGRFLHFPRLFQTQLFLAE